MNRVVQDGNFQGPTREIQVKTVDDLCAAFGVPNAIKVDVEGFELMVLTGALQTLADSSVCALIVEMNGSNNPFGFTDEELVELLSDQGFAGSTYHPESRTIEPRSGKTDTGNQIFVRNFDHVSDRLIRAPGRSVAGITV